MNACTMLPTKHCCRHGKIDRIGPECTIDGVLARLRVPTCSPHWRIAKTPLIVCDSPSSVLVCPVKVDRILGGGLLGVMVKARRFLSSQDRVEYVTRLKRSQ